MNKEELLKLNPQDATRFCVNKLKNKEWSIKQFQAVIKYYEDNHDKSYLVEEAKNIFHT